MYITLSPLQLLVHGHVALARKLFAELLFGHQASVHIDRASFLVPLTFFNLVGDDLPTFFSCLLHETPFLEVTLILPFATGC
ncbi:hypothetical protein F4775DRAFT_516786 [Biscogniauxia sp. FL1348]|nr:hypothetical protein F4775DRAFT_516786 [Biscogniauxia sp. FL1348]